MHGRALHAAHGHLPPLLEVRNLIRQYQDSPHRTAQVEDNFKKVVACVNTCLYAFMDRLGPSVLTKELAPVKRSEFVVELIDYYEDPNGKAHCVGKPPHGLSLLLSSLLLSSLTLC